MKITDLVEAPDGGYYKVSIWTSDGIHGTAIIPDRGRIAVYKEQYRWAPYTSFAWKIREGNDSEKLPPRGDHPAK